ncbi:hypothetical protein UFOVP17_40 [uncultured Caudovirales phage]|uniref:Uncharacterized protein n=1 Tax=uncultured Caudovirales phage TaxID=2100421 RepID=A0A6J5KIM9_9CAUD|nr:hypothetical protein UFOVP17_40 [uncultured Caudovirales phage]
MTTQNNITQYAQAIQEHLTGIFSPVPVYALFNRNFATQPKFVTWQLRNVHQDVYTGYQANKGIDRPTFQISIFTSNLQTGMADGLELTNTLLQSLHGYSGFFGTTHGFNISKADVTMLYTGYDDEIDLFNVFLDCTLDIPA